MLMAVWTLCVTLSVIIEISTIRSQRRADEACIRSGMCCTIGRHDPEAYMSDIYKALTDTMPSLLAKTALKSTNLKEDAEELIESFDTVVVVCTSLGTYNV